MDDFDFCKVASWSWNIYDGAFFAKMINEWKPLIIFAKGSIVYVLIGTGFASVLCFVYHFSTIFPKPWFRNPMLVKLLQRDSNPQPEILRVDSL